MDIYIAVDMPDIKRIKIDLWRNELSNYGLICEFHPEFDVLTQNGILQAKMKVLPGYLKHSFVFGDKFFNVLCDLRVTMNVETVETVQEKSEMNPNYLRIKNGWQRYTFEMLSCSDLPSIRFTYFAAATLTIISDGVLSIWDDRAQKSLWYSGTEAIQFCKERLWKLEMKHLRHWKKYWEFVEFTEWYKRDDDENFSLEDIY